MSESPRSTRGAVLSVAGPDGVGKSTLIDALVAEELDGRRIMRIRKVGILPRRTVPGAVVVEPHKDPVYSAPVSFAKVGYVFFDYLIGWALRIRPFVRSGGWVVLERGWWDMAVDPRRYRMSVPVSLMLRLGRLLPKPDVLFVLEAPPAIVYARKQELTLEELARQMRVWRELLPSEQSRTYLDAALPSVEVVASARQCISSMRVGLSDRRPVNLPRRGDTRWVVPRAPRSAAREGLRVYHPVTLRGLVGWNLARACASLGLFALLPKGQGHEAIVKDILDGHVPRDGSVAVARANHPSRYVALLLDSTGAATGVAKIAADEAGRAKLAKEGALVEQLSEHLPPALSTPRILKQEDGLLLLESVSWRARLRPWRLPLEVATALGEFFQHGGGSGSPSSGLTHGDFAPWNLLRTETGWVLLDWEEAATDGEPFWDVFHYLVQGHALLKRPKSGQLLAGLEGNGWVGAAIGAYAEAAGLRLADAEGHFDAYLRTSQSRLRPETKDGRAGLQARRALLSELRDR